MGEALVHSFGSSRWKGKEGGSSSTQVKVRMTVREFKEMVSKAESLKCDAGVVIFEGLRGGKLQSFECKGGKQGRTGVLETILED